MPPLILPLHDCRDPSLAGGKAVGLARLLAAGFAVPAGCCVTTAAYQQTLQAAGFAPPDRWHAVLQRTGNDRRQLLEETRATILASNVAPLVRACLNALPPIETATRRWAVRSSATNEDAARASFAGMYRTELGIAADDLGRAIAGVWASLWNERVVEYAVMSGSGAQPPAMAVVIQPLLDAQAAGVAYSIHPVTGRDNQVTIDAVRGLGAPLVDGTVTPDQYVVETDGAGQPVRIRKRITTPQPERLVSSTQGVCTERLSDAEHRRSPLADGQLFDIARVAKRIQRVFRTPVDVEWTFDTDRLWILQARPITAVQPSSDLTNDDCEWSRTNFKETMPEIPSPLGLSFLRHFMDAYILSHYRRLGCHIPAGLSSVRVLEGRPYLNVTLFHSLVGQLGGDPELNTEQMGGEPLRHAPPVRRIGWLALARAGWLIWREMRRCETDGPGWFAEMKRVAEPYRPDRIRSMPFDELVRCVESLKRLPDGREVTFGIAGGVGQCLQAFGRSLPRWLGADWRRLFNAALQGQGTVISAQQIVRLAELAQIARREPDTARWFLSKPWTPATVRDRLAGSAFLHALDRFLDDYGHRAAGESDVMSPRMAEQPESILAVLRAQIGAPDAAAPAEMLARQARSRREALEDIDRRLGWRWDRRLLFRWWYRRLTRFFALREANRHHLMYYSTATRGLLLRLGELLVHNGRLDAAEDIFFATMEEQERLWANEPRDWKGLIRARRAERTRQAAVTVPDTIRDWEEASRGKHSSTVEPQDGMLCGLPISAGSASGPVRLIRSTADWSRVQPGDILVAPVIDPGMAPLFGIAGGLIVEMGGTLSHGAIIAREYGLPAVANIAGATHWLKDGDCVELRADSGDVRRIAS